MNPLEITITFALCLLWVAATPQGERKYPLVAIPIVGLIILGVYAL